LLLGSFTACWEVVIGLGTGFALPPLAFLPGCDAEKAAEPRQSEHDVITI
jgi:hypothetical protein